MKSAPDGRAIFVWRGQDDDVSRLAEAIASACASKLFALNGHLVWLDKGLPTPVSRNLLADVIAMHIVSVRLVNSGTDWTCEYFTLDFAPQADPARGPSDQTLTDIAAMLVGLVAKGPRAVPKLSTQQEYEIRTRVKSGEPRAKVASAYGIDLQHLEMVWRQAG